MSPQELNPSLKGRKRIGCRIEIICEPDTLGKRIFSQIGRNRRQFCQIRHQILSCSDSFVCLGFSLAFSYFNCYSLLPNDVIKWFSTTFDLDQFCMSCLVQISHYVVKLLSLCVLEKFSAKRLFFLVEETMGFLLSLI